MQARNLPGRAIRQKVRELNHRREHGGGQRERRELLRAEVADDRRVHERIERPGSERTDAGSAKPRISRS